jgi:hypothetical protein
MQLLADLTREIATARMSLTIAVNMAAKNATLVGQLLLRRAMLIYAPAAALIVQEEHAHVIGMEQPAGLNAPLYIMVIAKSRVSRA